MSLNLSLLERECQSLVSLTPPPLAHKHTPVNPKRRISVLGSHLNIFIWSWKKNDYFISFNFHGYKFSTLPSKCLQELMEKEVNKSIPSFMYFCWGCEELRSWGGSTAPSSSISDLSLILPKELLPSLPLPCHSPLSNWNPDHLPPGLMQISLHPLLPALLSHFLAEKNFWRIAISYIEKKNLDSLASFQKLAISCPHLTSYYPFYKILHSCE